MCRLLLCIGLLCFLSLSCTDEINKENSYTYLGMNANEYIHKDPNLSIFARLAERSTSQTSTNNSSTIASLIGSYRQCMVLAPDNKALELHFDSLYGNPHINPDSVPIQEADRIVHAAVYFYKHESAISEMQLPHGFYMKSTIGNLYHFFQFGNWGDDVIVKINDYARIIKPDIKVDNGYVHIVDKVLRQGPSSVAEVIRRAPNMKIFYHLMNITCWADSLYKVEDKQYNEETYFELINKWIPVDAYSNPLYRYARKRLFGYTAFLETDDVFQKDWGVPAPIVKSSGSVENMDEIMAVIKARCQEAYPEATDADPTSQKNALNRFVSYHFVPIKLNYGYINSRYFEYSNNNYRRISSDEYDWFEHLGDSVDCTRTLNTLGTPARLIKITDVISTGDKRLNRHSTYRSGYLGDYKELTCDVEGSVISPDNGEYPNEAPNGFYYPINHMLLYDGQVRETVFNDRIRYHFLDAQPEIINSIPSIMNIRWGSDCQTTALIPGFCENMKIDRECYYVHSGFTCFNKYFGIITNKEENSICFKLFPVPFKGKWEIRISSLCTLLMAHIGNSSEFARMQRLGIFDMREKERLKLPFETQNYDKDLSKMVYNYDTIYQIEHDKQARLMGMMYLPMLHGNYYTYPKRESNPFKDWFYWKSARRQAWQNQVTVTIPTHFMRTIIYRGEMDPDKEYYIRLEDLTGRYKHVNLSYPYDTVEERNNYWFYGNMIELVPESVYDNPQKKEDPW